MLALLVIVIIVLLTVAQFYLKNKAMTSFGTMMASIFGFVLAFSYYEPLAGLLIGKGYGGQWAQSGIFFILFVLSFAVFRVLTDVLWDPDADFGAVATQATAVVCGLATGLIISGVFLITLAMMPASPKYPYPRFGDGQTAISEIRSAKKPLISADGLVSGLFSWMSKGSLSSSKSFAVYHTGFLDQLHLNGYKARSGVDRVAGKDSISVPKKGLRRLDGENENLTVVRMEVKRGGIKQGGAANAKGDVSFMPGQVRLVCKGGESNTRGSGTAFYPEGRVVSRRSAPQGQGKPLTGVMNGRVLMTHTLDEVLTLSKDDFGTGNRAHVDLAFQIPSGMTPVLLEFKDNVVVSVGGVEPASAEAEAALEGGASNGDSGTSDTSSSAGAGRPRDPNS
ncbi:MAG: CvpA family protein [Phycisphaerae bacterium]|nr:CvpA family protein [Phycisphaerae bacterium]